ncbi:MAG: hypothetical protein NVS1B10_08390 [Candidatus Saccharimonadales bacterium]
MHFDIIFLDISANKYYDRQTLEKSSLGGTEATVIRVAEGLASLGLKVAVLQSKPDYFEPTMGQFCFFLHANDIPDLTCSHFVQLRGISNAKLFPDAKQYVWLHDLAVEGMKEWTPDLEKWNIRLIGVSRWHKKNIKNHTNNYEKTSYIYNPVPDALYDTPRPAYDPNLLVWLSSPHKGLGKALELFKEIRKSKPSMQFLVFNPGYFTTDDVTLSSMPGVVVAGALPCGVVWQNVKRALCVFYPAQWEETFGCIASESNAMGVPMATYRKGALPEVVSSDCQMVEDGDEQSLIKRVLQWSDGYRPIVSGKNEFKFSTIIQDWVKLLAKS